MAKYVVGKHLNEINEASVGRHKYLLGERYAGSERRLVYGQE